MNCRLIRTQFRVDGIFSDLLDDQGKRIAVTLEHAYSGDLGGFGPKIPNGTFTCRRRLSPHFGYDLFQVMDVPGCAYIEIHCGNFNRDSEGCVLLGKMMAANGSEEMITSSRETFDAFMALQNGCDEFQLEVSGP